MTWGQTSFFTGLLGRLDKLIFFQISAHARLRERPQLVVMVMAMGRTLVRRGNSIPGRGPM